MKDLGTQFSTTEGWGALLLTLLTVLKSLGWLPADVEANSAALTVGQVVLAVVALIALVKKFFRKGSVPFVADAPKP